MERIRSKIFQFWSDTKVFIYEIQRNGESLCNVGETFQWHQLRFVSVQIRFVYDRKYGVDELIPQPLNNDV